MYIVTFHFLPTYTFLKQKFSPTYISLKQRFSPIYTPLREKFFYQLIPFSKYKFATIYIFLKKRLLLTYISLKYRCFKLPLFVWDFVSSQNRDEECGRQTKTIKYRTQLLRAEWVGIRIDIIMDLMQYGSLFSFNEYCQLMIYIGNNRHPEKIGNHFQLNQFPGICSSYLIIIWSK